MTPDDIRGLREALGVTQSEFASRLGVTADAVRGWERGRRRPSASAALRLAALGKGESTVESKGIPNAPEGAGRAIASEDVSEVQGTALADSSARVETSSSDVEDLRARNADLAASTERAYRDRDAAQQKRDLLRVELDDVQRERDSALADRDTLGRVLRQEVLAGMVPTLSAFLARYLDGEDVRDSAETLRGKLNEWTAKRGGLARV